MNIDKFENEKKMPILKNTIAKYPFIGTIINHKNEWRREGKITNAQFDKIDCIKCADLMPSIDNDFKKLLLIIQNS